MADWRDVMEARTVADRMASAAETQENLAAATVLGLLAVQAELRALSTLLDNALREASNRVRV
jgi:hypothetical protein